MGYFLYNVLLLVTSPIILAILLVKPRCRHGLLQRLGWVPGNLRNLTAPVLWIHAVSLGEVTSVVPLVKGLRDCYPHWVFLVSTVTETGREAVEQQLAGVAQHCYCPLDFPWAVQAYVRCLRPTAYIVVETELWPNLLRAFSCQDIPIFLVNGRLSSTSFKRYLYIQGFMTQLLSTITLSLMQSERDARRIIELGAKPSAVHASGNMKFDHVNDESDSHGFVQSPSLLGVTSGEKLIIAGSTHSEEEDQLLRCYKRLNEAFPSLVLLLAPRHIERVNQVEDKVLKHGLLCIRKSRVVLNEEIIHDKSQPRVIILDTRGELSLLYSLGWIAFVGGTLTPVGGHNLLEPARWGIPVFFGPYTDHCSEVAQLLLQSGGGIEVQNELQLFDKISNAYQHDSWTEKVGHAAREVVGAHRGVVLKNIEYIRGVLEDQSVKSPNQSNCPSSISSS